MAKEAAGFFGGMGFKAEEAQEEEEERAKEAIFV